MVPPEPPAPPSPPLPPSDLASLLLLVLLCVVVALFAAICDATCVATGVFVTVVVLFELDVTDGSQLFQRHRLPPPWLPANDAGATASAAMVTIKPTSHLILGFKVPFSFRASWVEMLRRGPKHHGAMRLR